MYSFCRWADDLGDEIGDAAESLRLLGWWRAELEALYAGRASHPVFVALKDTLTRHPLPMRPFRDLIRAFEQDQTVTRYRDFEQLFEYCRYLRRIPWAVSVLGLKAVIATQAQWNSSDATCTALQLANFWRCADRFPQKPGVFAARSPGAPRLHPVEGLAERRFDDHFRAAMKEAVSVARELFLRGFPLADQVDRRLAIDLELFSRGGLKILEKIEQQDYPNVLATIASRDPEGALRSGWSSRLGTLSRRVFSSAA